MKVSPGARFGALLGSCFGLICMGALIADEYQTQSEEPETAALPEMEEYSAPREETECCEMCIWKAGDPLEMCQIPAGYNQAATIELNGCYDFFVTGSFIYWKASTDGLNLGTSYPYNPSLASESTTALVFPSPGSKTVFHHTEYKPGFKIGAGYNSQYDNWTAYAEYTWLHSQTHSNHSAPFGDVYSLDWVTFQTNDLGTAIRSTWDLHINLLDVRVSRDYYVGRRLTLEPHCGVRAAWIDQEFSLSMDLANQTNLFQTGFPVFSPPFENPGHSHYKNKSWALGPRVGLEADWLFGCGFSMLGKAAFSILFTRYTTVSINQDRLDSNPVGFYTNPLTAQLSGNYDTVRPSGELGLGVTWGKYFSCDRYHLELAATYDFQVFWRQNMLKAYDDTVGANIALSPQDLYLHGPTITARFDF